MFDGKTPHWYHPKCFFTRNRPKAVGDISHFDSLRWEDQEKIRAMLEASLTGAPIPTKGGKKGSSKSATEVAAAGGGISANGTLLKEFRLEYAKSGASKCGACEEKIKKVWIFFLDIASSGHLIDKTEYQKFYYRAPNFNFNYCFWKQFNQFLTLFLSTN
jgi:hypothetical protein